MKLLKLNIILCLLVRVNNGELIRPIDVYKQIIFDVCNYYQCKYITIFYTFTNDENTTDVETLMHLKNLQLSFSELNIMTNLADVKIIKLIMKKCQILCNMKQSLFVLLHESGGVKDEFELLTASSVDISEPTWLLFNSNQSIIDNYFINIYIPFNCKFMVSMVSRDTRNELIWEIYRIERSQTLRRNIFGTWNSTYGLNAPELTFYQRRKNLYGHLFRVAIIDDSPMSRIIKQHGKLIFSGVVGAVIQVLENQINFTVTYQEVSGYGDANDDKSADTGMNALIQNTSDIFAAGFRLTSHRVKLIDFAMILFTDTYRLYMKKPVAVLEWDKYVKPFNVNIWIAIIIKILLIGTLITFIKISFNKINGKQLNAIKYRRYIKRIYFILADNIFIVFGAMCNQAMSTSHINSIRVIQLTMHITGYVIVTAYSAVVISSLTVNDLILPFKTIGGLYREGTYKMGVLNASADYSYFKYHRHPSVYGIYKKFLSIDHNLPVSYWDGLKRVCDNNKYVFMSQQSTVWEFHDDNCVLIELDPVMKSPLTIGLQKNSPYRDLFNSQIIILLQSGIVRKYLKEVRRPSNDDVEIWTAVELVDIMPLIVLLSASITLSIIILFIEKLINIKLRHCK